MVVLSVLVNSLFLLGHPSQVLLVKVHILSAQIIILNRRTKRDPGKEQSIKSIDELDCRFALARDRFGPILPNQEHICKEYDKGAANDEEYYAGNQNCGRACHERTSTPVRCVISHNLGQHLI